MLAVTLGREHDGRAGRRHVERVADRGCRAPARGVPARCAPPSNRPRDAGARPCSTATAPHAARRPSSSASTSIGSVGAAASSARASVRSPSTSAASRVTSRCAPCRSSTRSSGPSASRFSRRRLSAARGVRSWCDASATNACWDRTSASRRAAVALNERARPWSSGGSAGTSTRAARSPSPSRAAPRSSSASGRVNERASSVLTRSTTNATTPQSAASSSQLSRVLSDTAKSDDDTATRRREPPVRARGR